MKQVVQHETIGEIVYEESAWTGKKTLTINGEQLQKKDKTTFVTNSGEQVALNGNFLKGASITVGGETIQIIPAVKWYEVVLSILPFLLIMIWGNVVELCLIVPVVGGAIGGLISGVFSVSNLIIIKRVDKIWLKVLISLGMLAATFGICCGIGYAIISAI